MDLNGNGYLSYSEVEIGFETVIKLPKLFDLSPVLMRAFNIAKTKAKSVSKYGDDYISVVEYRYLLKYVRIFFEYWIAFDQIDKSGDSRISKDEFIKASWALSQWGVDMNDPEARWHECDANNGG